MGQEEVLTLLIKTKVPLTTKEIVEMLEETRQSVCESLKKLLKREEVKALELNKDLAMKFYSCKRRMRLYYA